MRNQDRGGEPALRAEAKRFVSFLVVGGSSTILNLAVVTHQYPPRLAVHPHRAGGL